ncbi:uncharacterized protein BDZ99DRAFT_471132 [Mytilinidion resinicola]|uniref:F-box domain-containing protein n=1 Tax=Mytilinidion resinicola TaxID=574789 RepID=A0A6A6Z6C0_9PEZI|nr:uncharacterized protein BDZ99DRAFT_471132 [Mytilinidion resinicola]KAF2815807.1 hypothetical protein BDZ99DRAFT_471132 [Mytilinidion resinicola]
MEQCRLLSLADELLVSIVETLANDRQSLARLASTCAHLKEISEPYIYRDIKLQNTVEADHIASSIKADEARALAVHSLDSRLGSSTHYSSRSPPASNTATNFNFFMGDFKNLRNWTLESPYTNYSRWMGRPGSRWIDNDMERIIEVFQLAGLASPLIEQPQPLPLLQSFTLHPHGDNSRYYRLDRLGAIFLHPSLRTIHLSCVTIDEGLEYLQQYQHTTPLTSLIFDECEISAPGLASVLCAPKGLTDLTLGENMHHSDYTDLFQRRRLRDSQDGLVGALLQQAHSLRFFKHLSETSSPIRGLNVFPALRRLELTRVDIRQLFKFEHFLPSDLESLILIEPREHWIGQLDHVPSVLAAHWLRNLKTLSFIVTLHYHLGVLSDKLWGDALAPRIHKLAYELRTGGVCFRILARNDYTGAMPPYLDGEKIPEPVVVYDSQDYSFEARLGEDIPLEERRNKDELTEDELNVLKRHTDRQVL